MNARLHHNRNHQDRMNRFRRERRSKAIVAGAVVVLAIVGVVIYFVAYFGSQKDVTCTIESKERTVKVTDGNSETQKFVYTEECGVLQVEDSLFFAKFNSADTYASLKEGETYDIKQVGFRIGFFSVFPNILKASPSRES